MSATTGAPRVDGRASRTLRSRAAICNACLDLIEEGVLQPSADQVAARAGLSRRSVFNHFGDLSELYDAVVEAAIERCAPLRTPIDGGLPVEERVAAWIAARARFLEATSVFTWAVTAQALAQATSSEALRISRDAFDAQHDELERLFTAELSHLAHGERSDVIEAIAAATAPLVWEHLRRTRSLSKPRSRAIMERSVRSLLRDATGEAR